MMGNKLVADVVRSLRAHPEEWETDGYRVRHKSGISVWIANGHYGLAVQLMGQDVYGGVTGWSSFLGPLIPWRRKLRALALGVGARKLTEA